MGHLPARIHAQDALLGVCRTVRPPASNCTASDFKGCRWHGRILDERQEAKAFEDNTRILAKLRGCPLRARARSLPSRDPLFWPISASHEESHNWMLCLHS